MVVFIYMPLLGFGIEPKEAVLSQALSWGAVILTVLLIGRPLANRARVWIFLGVGFVLQVAATGLFFLLKDMV